MENLELNQQETNVITLELNKPSEYKFNEIEVFLSFESIKASEDQILRLNLDGDFALVTITKEAGEVTFRNVDRKPVIIVSYKRIDDNTIEVSLKNPDNSHPNDSMNNAA